MPEFNGYIHELEVELPEFSKGELKDVAHSAHRRHRQVGDSPMAAWHCMLLYEIIYILLVMANFKEK